ncbi:MAG: hypothetical protein V4510_03055 [bacterium]
MRAQLVFLAFLLVAGLSLSGCSGGGGGSSSPSTSSTTSTGSPQLNTVTQTVTISGTVTTITTVITKTATSSGETTAPGPLPDIANVTVTPGPNSAAVVWIVSGGTGAVSSHAEYGYASVTNFTGQTPPVPNLGPQSATIAGLASCSDYKVRIAASDAAGTKVQTNAFLFSTTGAAPAVPSLAVPPSTVIDTQFRVTWNVTGPADTSSHVAWGITSTLDTSTADVSGPGAKSVLITGLTAGQTYNFQVVATSPCGTTSSVVKTQKTATVEHVDINNGAAAAAAGAGGVNSFSPGSTLPGKMNVAAGQPLVFDVSNKDSASHEFHITDSAGNALNPGYSSGTITAGNTVHFQAGVILPAGTYHMKCLIHAGMDGMITAA